jgi:hypothetical protein
MKDSLRLKIPFFIKQVVPWDPMDGMGRLVNPMGWDGMKIFFNEWDGMGWDEVTCTMG